MNHSSTTANFTTNITSHIHEAPMQLSLYMVVVHPIILLIHASNVLIIATCKRLHTPANGMLTSLSISDALLLLFLFFKCQNGEGHACHAITVPNIDIPIGLCYTASLLSTVGISLDKYISIQYSLRYRTIVTKRKIIAFLASVWIFSGILSLTATIIGILTRNSFYFDLPQYAVHLPCCLFLLACAVYIRRIRNKHERRITRQNKYFGNEEEKLHILQRLRGSVLGMWRLNVITAITVFFVTLFYGLFKYGPLKENPIIWTLLRIVYLFYLTSNPILYICVTCDLRNEYRRLFCCKNSTVDTVNRSIEDPPN